MGATPAPNERRAEARKRKRKRYKRNVRARRAQVVVDRFLIRALSERFDFNALLRGDPCSYCSAPPPSHDLDHIEPRSLRSGMTKPDLNRTPSCRQCNSNKAAKPLLHFLLERATRPERDRAASVAYREHHGQQPRKDA